MFRDRFWVSLLLSVPVFLYSPMIQEWLGFSMPAFPGSAWMAPFFSVIIFVYGGLPFLRLAVPELINRQPGMMTLITLAINVAFVYSLAATLIGAGASFYWELVTLIDVMLLGHWLEMRSVRQASGALNELARLMPDTAERVLADGQLETVPVGQLRTGDLVLVRPGASVPADGQVDGAEPGLGHRLQRRGPAAGGWRAGALGSPAYPGDRRPVHVAEHDHRGDQRPAAAPGSPIGNFACFDLRQVALEADTRLGL
jgi:Cu2+-exporting ATPase